MQRVFGDRLHLKRAQLKPSGSENGFWRPIGDQPHPPHATAVTSTRTLQLDVTTMRLGLRHD